MAGDIAELMEASGFADADVLGHSMGGKTAMEFALQFPGKVRRLAVVDITPRAYEPRHSSILNAMLSLHPHQFGSRKEAEEALAPAIPDLAVRQFLLKNLARDAAGRLGWRLGLKEIAANYPNLNAALTGSRVFAGPVQFIRGDRSDYVRDEDFALCRSLFPAAIFRTVQEAGHWVHADATRELVHLVRQFLAQ